ncbi:acyltransferase family protein [Echinicola sediminis]
MKRSFYPNIEGFRGVAVFLVLLSHWIVIKFFPHLIFLKLGYLGVNFLFVLSGFLITEILFIEIYNDISPKTILKNFFAKRLLRIFPIYYLTILILGFFNSNESRELLPWTLSYTLNVGQVWFGAENDLFMHIWSLCVEEQFYLIWPFILLFVNKVNYKWLILFTLLGSVIFKYLAIFFMGNYESIIHSSLFSALDALCIGGGLAYLKCFKSSLFDKISQIPSIVVLCLLITFWLTSYYEDYSYMVIKPILNLFAGGIACIVIVKAVSGDQTNLINRFFKLKPVKYLGKISYGVYLYHWILFFLLMPSFKSFWNNLDFSGFGRFGIIQYNMYAFSFCFFLGLTVLLSTFSFYLIEKPILKFKRYF